MKKIILRVLIATLVFSAFSVCVHAQSYAITNAKIVIVSGPAIEKGTVVIRDGLITDVGASAKIPADARVFDAAGLTVYPGFFDAYTNIGLSAPAAAQPTPAGGGGRGGPQAPQSGTNSNYPAGLQPETSATDLLKGGESQFESQRNAGFTTVLTAPKDGIFNGQSAIINLAGESVSAMLIKAPFAQHISYTTLRTGYPLSLLGTFSAIRQMFLDAQRLQEWQKMYAANPRGLKRPDEDRSLEALFPALNGQVPVVFNANTEREILRSLDLAKEFNLKPIINGGDESGNVAARLKAQNAIVLLSLNYPKKTTQSSPEADPEPLEVLRLRANAPKNAARLAQAGVKFAFQSGGMQNLNDFFANAAKATENGLSKDDAVRAMTLSAAEIFGVADRLGSIETGKIANLVVTKGEVLAKDKAVTHVFVDGKFFEQKPPAKPDEKKPGSAGGEAAKVAQAGGTWNITIEVPGQPITATLNLTQQGDKLTGNMQSQFLGTTDIKNGAVTANGFSFDANVTVQGQSFDISLSGKVNGNQVSGSVNSPMGAVPFSGTKVP